MNNKYHTRNFWSRFKKGAVRIWKAEVSSDNNCAFWRTISGIKDGNLVVAEWRESYPKNIGKKKRNYGRRASHLEANTAKVKKEGQGYFEDITQIDNFTKFNPMLAQDYAKLKKALPFPVYSQPKLDGIRCIARADGLWTRAEKENYRCSTCI